MHDAARTVSILAGVLDLAVLLPAAAWAQEGALAGVVRDASGAVLPGVTVDLSSPALIGRVRSTVTGENGQYRILDLPVGTYEVRFSLPSFSTVRRDNIVITIGFTATINAELRVGDITETVVVTGEAPTVDVQNARQVTVFTGDELRPADLAQPLEPHGARRGSTCRISGR